MPRSRVALPVALFALSGVTFATGAPTLGALALAFGLFMLADPK